jgi:hypothetical protein
MDIPGFDDIYVSDATILSNITDSLIAAFNDKYEI